MGKTKFIIAGVNDLNVLKYIQELDWSKHIGHDLNVDEYFCFEPMRRLNEFIHGFDLTQINAKVNILQKAVWIDDAGVEFREANDHWSSTCCPTKMTGRFAKSPYMVESVDFSSWLANNVQEDDQVIVDMDIECSEYKVLPKLIADGTINLIDYLSIEWHNRKCGTWFDDEMLHMQRTLHKHVHVLDHDSLGIGGA